MKVRASAVDRQCASRMRVAACIVVGVLLVAACGGSTSSTTASAGACTAFGGYDSRAGEPAITRSPSVALLRNVQVQASACVDEVGFLFFGGRPGWSVGYRDDPQTEDPSGRPVDVAGEATLVVRFEPASGVDATSATASMIYDGPMAMTPPAPSGVAEVRRIGDFEGVTSWAIGLPARRPFEVVTRSDDWMVVRFAPTDARTTTCALAGSDAVVHYPASWYAELSDRWRCRFFDPAPFVVHPSTDQFDWSVSVSVDAAPAAEVAARTAGPRDRVTTAHMELDGRAATRLDVVASGDGLVPAGYEYRVYVIDFGGSAVSVSGDDVPPGVDVGPARADVDTIARSIALA